MKSGCARACTLASSLDNFYLCGVLVAPLYLNGGQQGAGGQPPAVERACRGVQEGAAAGAGGHRVDVAGSEFHFLALASSSDADDVASALASVGDAHHQSAAVPMSSGRGCTE